MLPVGSKQSLEKKWNHTKKKTLCYKEQNPEKVKEYKEKIKDIPKEKIAYIDETGIDSCIYREYGYAPRGQKVYDKIPRRKFQRTNIIAAKLGNEIIAPMQYNSKMDSALFEMWFEKCLLPYLEEDIAIVMDNDLFTVKSSFIRYTVNMGSTLFFFRHILLN